MNNIIVFCETDNGKLCDISLELLTKARGLAAKLGCQTEALLIGSNVSGLADELYAYGAEKIFLAESPQLEFYRTLPYASIIINLFKEIKPCATYLKRASQRSYSRLYQSGDWRPPGR